MIDGQKVGVGISCYKRVAYSRVALRSVFDVLNPIVDEVVLYDDGSPNRSEYQALVKDAETWPWRGRFDSHVARGIAQIVFPCPRILRDCG